MIYKLMAVDIDGTLLNDRGELTENTKKAIRQGVEKGLIHYCDRKAYTGC